MQKLTMFRSIQMKIHSILDNHLLPLPESLLLTALF